ncbi:uncharacterized protein L203_102290 [Cryptococcus depauperatus CBS 7841]|uniref:Uncharacterized protein n=1 Tax=Cryptococcus depauperatus CBS 7841 TaxID=1295531 RepID=A0AAJ8JRI7_9TREE
MDQELSRGLTLLFLEERTRGGPYAIDGKDEVENAQGLTLADAEENKSFQAAIQASTDRLLAASKDSEHLLRHSDFQHGPPSHSARHSVSQGGTDNLTIAEPDGLDPESNDEYVKTEISKAVDVANELTKRMLTRVAATGKQGKDSVGDIDPRLVDKLYRDTLRRSLELIKSNCTKDDTDRISIASLLARRR